MSSDPSTPSAPGPGTTTEADPEFASLLAAAREIAELAYAPYSRFRVGAAALTDDGRLVRGCNVENAGYGVTLCAECGLIGELIAGGGGRLRRFVCVGGDETLTRDERGVVMPCGRCRQLLSEHAAEDLVLLTPQGLRGMTDVLPQAFGPADLRAADLRAAGPGPAGSGTADPAPSGSGPARPPAHDGDTTALHPRPEELP